MDTDYSFYVQYCETKTGWLPKEAVWSFLVYGDSEGGMNKWRTTVFTTAVDKAKEEYLMHNGHKPEYSVVWEHV